MLKCEWIFLRKNQGYDTLWPKKLLCSNSRTTYHHPKKIQEVADTFANILFPLPDRLLIYVFIFLVIMAL